MPARTSKKEQAEEFLIKLTTAGGKKACDVLKQEMDNKSLMKSVMMDWLPAGDAKFHVIVICLPSSVTTQKYRAELF